MLNGEAITEFKKLYLKEYRVNLTNNQAMELGTRLVRLVKIVYGSNLPEKWIPKIDRKENRK